MNGTGTFTAKLICLLVGSVALHAAGPDYFPLQVGNSWAYKVTQGQSSRPGSINVEARETINGRDYFRVDFFEQTLYLRYAENGNLLKFDKESGTEGIWLPIGNEPGQPVQTEFDDCSREATVASREAELKTVLGQFNTALEIRYRPNCADAGITVQYLLPHIGLVLHETMSIAGPVRHELVYVRSGFTNVTATQNAFTLSTDSPTYKAGTPEMLARLTLRVTEPVMLTFPSSQNSDLRITDISGNSVYVWSADKLFAQVFREERIEPGERTFVMSIPIETLAPGRYQAEGWLATRPKTYSAVVTFDILR